MKKQTTTLASATLNGKDHHTSSSSSSTSTVPIVMNAKAENQKNSGDDRSKTRLKDQTIHTDSYVVKVPTSAWQVLGFVSTVSTKGLSQEQGQFE